VGFWSDVGDGFTDVLEAPFKWSAEVYEEIPIVNNMGISEGFRGFGDFVGGDWHSWRENSEKSFGMFGSSFGGQAAATAVGGPGAAAALGVASSSFKPETKVSTPKSGSPSLLPEAYAPQEYFPMYIPNNPEPTDFFAGDTGKILLYGGVGLLALFLLKRK
jgi:hypothetical protein